MAKFSPSTQPSLLPSSPSVDTNEDVTAPLVFNVVYPTTLDLANSRMFTVTFDATDDLSGIGSITVAVSVPITNFPILCVTSPVSGNGELAVSVTATCSLDQYSPSGTWSLSTAVSDNAFNPGGLVNFLEVSNPGPMDVEAPVVANLVVPSVVDLSMSSTLICVLTVTVGEIFFSSMSVLLDSRIKAR